MPEFSLFDKKFLIGLRMGTLLTLPTTHRASERVHFLDEPILFYAFWQ